VSLLFGSKAGQNLLGILLASNAELTTEQNYLSSKNSNDLKLPPNTQSRTPQRDRQLTESAFDAAVIKLFTEDIKVCFV